MDPKSSIIKGLHCNIKLPNITDQARGYKLFSCTTLLSTKFILLINDKMRDLKEETNSFVGILVFMSSWNFMLSWVEHEKFYNLETRYQKHVSVYSTTRV